jgi:hypothetical protein
VKKDVPSKLKKRNLQINEAKTEEYTIKRGGDEKWKKCKYVGSLLDTEEDIKRRKQLAMAAFTQHKPALSSKHIALKTRLRIMNAYVSSIFMYNSETWTLTKTLEMKIDAFQRNILRKILNIKWPHTISNTKLYERTGEENWSQKIRKRRLRWLGHLMRLPETAPVQQALTEALRPTKRPPGKPKTTWVSRMNMDLKELSPQLKLGSEKLRVVTSDRAKWRALTKGESAVPTNGGEA